MKLLFITSEGFDTPNSINHLCETLLEDILKTGISVHSISSHKTGEYRDIPECLSKYTNFQYDIIKRKKINKNNFVKRYLDELKYVFRAKKIWKKHKKEYDIILLQSNPNSFLHAIYLKRIINKPIILNLYDVFPGHAMSIGVIKNKLVFNIFQKLQNILYKKCKYIVAMSEDMKQQLLGVNVQESKLKVINNWFDDSIFKTIDRKNNKFFLKFPELDQNKFYIQFAGLLGYVFDYNIFLETAELLQNDKDIVFLLIGDGNQKDLVISELEKRKITNVKYYPWQPLDMIADVYNACDVGFIPLKKGVIGNGIPSKACQLMAAGKVVLNSVEESDYSRLFKKNEMGINVTTYNAKDIASVIVNLKSDNSLRNKIGNNAREYSYAHYSRNTNTKLFIDLINECAD